MVSFEDIKTIFEKFKKDTPKDYDELICDFERYIKLSFLYAKAKDIFPNTIEIATLSDRTKLYKASQLYDLKQRVLSQRYSEKQLLGLLKSGAAIRATVYKFRFSVRRMSNALNRASEATVETLIKMDSSLKKSLQSVSLLPWGQHHLVQLGSHIYHHSPAASIPILLDWGSKKLDRIFTRFCAAPFDKIALIVFTLFLLASASLSNPQKIAMLLLLPAMNASIHYMLPEDQVDYKHGRLMKPRLKLSVPQLQILQGLLISGAIACMTKEYQIMTQTLVTMGAGITTFLIGEGITRIIALVAPMDKVDRFVLSKAIALLVGLVGYKLTDNALRELELRFHVQKNLEAKLLNSAIPTSSAQTSSDNRSVWQWRFMRGRQPMEVREWEAPGFETTIDCSPYDAASIIDRDQAARWNGSLVTIVRKGELQRSYPGCDVVSKSSGRVTIFKCTLNENNFGKEAPLDCQLVSSTEALGLGLTH